MKQLFILLTFFCMATSALAEKIIVPTQFSTIQEAIDSSVNGDTVLVMPGIYFENLKMKGKSIVLTSMFYLNMDKSFISTTIINGSTPANPDSASCIMMTGKEDSTTVVQGFTLTGGKGTKWKDIHNGLTYREGGGILMEFCSAVIQYNYIIDNEAIDRSGNMSSAGGGGIRSGDGNPTIINNMFSRNKGRYGAAIVFNYSKGKVKNNIIVDNSGGEDYGGSGIWATGDNNIKHFVQIENNTIAYNSCKGTGSQAQGKGAVMIFANKAIMKNNIIWGNVQSSGVSVRTYLGGTIDAKYNSVSEVLTGEGNINGDPLFDSTGYFLKSASPTIDAGENLVDYRDLADPADTTLPLAPAQGTRRNDMGAYGGPRPMIAMTDLVLGREKVEMKSNAQIVFPNPVEGILHFKLKGNESVKYLELLSIDSKKTTSILAKDIIQNGNIIEIDIHSYPAGAYILTVYTSSDKVYNDKVLFQ